MSTPYVTPYRIWPDWGHVGRCEGARGGPGAPLGCPRLDPSLEAAHGELGVPGGDHACWGRSSGGGWCKGGERQRPERRGGRGNGVSTAAPPGGILPNRRKWPYPLRKKVRKVMLMTSNHDDRCRVPAPPTSVPARPSTKPASTAPAAVAQPLGCHPARKDEQRQRNSVRRRAAARCCSNSGVGVAAV